MILSIQGNDIDLDKIDRIGRCGIANNIPYFRIYFISGRELLIENEDRDKLVQIWKNSLYKGPIINSIRK